MLEVHLLVPGTKLIHSIFLFLFATINFGLFFSSYCWDLGELIIDINFLYLIEIAQGTKSHDVYTSIFFELLSYYCCLLLLNCQFYSVPLIGTVIFSVADWCVCLFLELLLFIKMGVSVLAWTYSSIVVCYTLIFPAQRMPYLAIWGRL